MKKVPTRVTFTVAIASATRMFAFPRLTPRGDDRQAGENHQPEPDQAEDAVIDDVPRFFVCFVFHQVIR